MIENYRYSLKNKNIDTIDSAFDSLTALVRRRSLKIFKIGALFWVGPLQRSMSGKGIKVIKPTKFITQL